MKASELVAAIAEAITYIMTDEECARLLEKFDEVSEDDHEAARDILRELWKRFRHLEKKGK